MHAERISKLNDVGRLRELETLPAGGGGRLGWKSSSLERQRSSQMVTERVCDRRFELAQDCKCQINYSAISRTRPGSGVRGTST